MDSPNLVCQQHTWQKHEQYDSGIPCSAPLAPPLCVIQEHKTDSCNLLMHVRSWWFQFLHTLHTYIFLTRCREWLDRFTAPTRIVSMLIPTLLFKCVRAGMDRQAVQQSRLPNMYYVPAEPPKSAPRLVLSASNNYFFCGLVFCRCVWVFR